MEGKSINASTEEGKLVGQRMRRCAQWLVSQGAQPQLVEDEMPPLEDAEPSEDLMSIPNAVDEDNVKPRKVPHRKLRTHGLRLECEWRRCLYVTGDYDAFQRHVRAHIPHLHVVQGPDPQYKCLWDICHHQSSDGREMTRHVNFHSYHAKLMAVGLSAKFNWKLPHCAKDSTQRNKIPVHAEDYKCRWIECDQSFTAIQDFFSHVHRHVQFAERVCSWGGCGCVCARHLSQHVRPHIGERVIACPHCGARFCNNVRFKEHLQRQNIPSTGALTCGLCGKRQATARLLRMHARQHVCVYACTFCDMTTQTLSALSTHVRYRHLSGEQGVRMFTCDLCKHSCVTKLDLRRHIATHDMRKKEKSPECEVEAFLFKKPGKKEKRYICHMCPDGEGAVYSRGTRLTSHLVKKHGAQWPDGHCRFRYQKSEDGYYRLTTTRYESLEVTRHIMRGGTSPKEPIEKDLSVKIKKKSSATSKRPTLFEIDFNARDLSDSDSESKEAVKLERLKDSLHEEFNLKNEPNVLKNEPNVSENEPNVSRNEANVSENDSNVLENEPYVLKSEPNIEITMCDVDEDGNVIRSEVVNSGEVIIGV